MLIIGQVLVVPTDILLFEGTLMYVSYNGQKKQVYTNCL